MLPKYLTRDLKSRLNMLAGQLHGVVKMRESKPKTQVKATSVPPGPLLCPAQPGPNE